MADLERPLNSERTREELDSLVINMELTLMSIIQGIALYFLADASVELLGKMQFQFLPYVVSGLLIILLFWSRSLIHILTIIRWPLEFVHNFIYISFTLIESVMFKQIGNVLNWFALNIVGAILIWLTFVFDLRMIHRVKDQTLGGQSDQLFDMVDRDQRLNIRLVAPSMVLFSAAGVFSVLLAPQYFLEKGGHFVLAYAQLVFLLGYLIYTLRFYNLIAPLILIHRQKGW
jgi:hypothetical protein